MGWSDRVKFKTPPAAGSDELSFVIYGDMGKAPLDPSVEHYIQVIWQDLLFILINKGDKVDQNTVLTQTALRLDLFCEVCTFLYAMLWL